MVINIESDLLFKGVAFLILKAHAAFLCLSFVNNIVTRMLAIFWNS